jgi:hypothetical protein
MLSGIKKIKKNKTSAKEYKRTESYEYSKGEIDQGFSTKPRPKYW